MREQYQPPIENGSLIDRARAVAERALALGGVVGAAAIGTAALPRAEAQAYSQEASGAAAIEATDSEQARDPYRFAARVLYSMNHGPRNENIIANSLIVLPEGTVIDKAPTSAPLMKVKPNYVMELVRPRLRKQGGHLYAAVWHAHAPWKNQAVDAKHYYWVNLDRASKMPGYGVYNFIDYNPDDSRDYPFTFPVIVAPKQWEGLFGKGNLMVTSPSNVVHPRDMAEESLVKANYEQTHLEGWVEPAKKPVRFIKANTDTPINPAWAYNP